MNYLEKTPIVVYGFGNVGKTILNLCDERPYLKVVGIITNRPKNEIYDEFKGDPATIEHLVINSDPDMVLETTGAKVVLHCKTSRMPEAIEHFSTCAKYGASIVSSCEEFAWPLAQHKALMPRLQKLTEKNNIAIIQAGVNPGLVFDKLTLCLASVAWDITHISIRRIIDPTVFGPKIRKQLGIGHSEEDFHKKIKDKSIAGHIGFLESATIIATQFGLKITDYEEFFDPIIAETNYNLHDGDVIKAGTSVGVIHRAKALCGDTLPIDFTLDMHVTPSEMGWELSDTIELGGTHPINVQINPGISGIIATASHMVNNIPRLLKKDPGIYLESHDDLATPLMSSK